MPDSQTPKAMMPFAETRPESRGETREELKRPAAVTVVKVQDESSRDAIPALADVEFKPRRRPGRTDGITPRFENMLQEAQRTGFESGYRAAFQALGLDAKAVRVLRVMNVREAQKILPNLLPTDRVAVLRRLDEMPPGDD
jgi:hypothetical protein